MTERKKILTAVLITFLVTAILTSFLWATFSPISATVKRLIKDNYVLTVDNEKIDKYMAKGAAASLGDDYSYYLTSEEYSALMSDITGEYKGIGVEVYVSAEGFLTVSNVFMNTPAEGAGLRAGDIIIKVDNIEVTSETSADAISYMRGLSEEGKNAETMTLSVLRGEKMFDASVTRAEIVAQTIFSKDIEGVKYLRISSFSPSTFSEFVNALQTAENSRGLILDVRDNPGGLLEIVSEICDVLLPEATIVYTEDRSGKQIFYKSDKKCIEIPIVVLTNENSASASEILAGALKDNKIGTLVGKKTFGKGSVQEIFSLKDQSALKLTTAYYYTPSGVCINGIGISPDYDISLPEESLLKPLQTLTFEEDTQLQKAIELIISGSIE